MKTTIYKLLNDIYILIGKIILYSANKKNNIYNHILNVLYKTKHYLENMYFDFCLKPNLEKELEKEKKIKELIIFYLFIINYNYHHNNIKLITYPNYIITNNLN